MQKLILKSKVKLLENKYKKSVSKILDSSEKQRDLTNVEFILVSSGLNENWDGFPKQRLAEVYQTAIGKPMDIAHLIDEKESYIKNSLDPRFSNLSTERNTNTIIGHITNSLLVDDLGNPLSQDDIEKIKKMEGFDQKDPIHIVALASLYSFIFPKTIASLKKLISEEKMFVSVETFFSDWDYLLVEKNEIIKSNESNRFLNAQIGGTYHGCTVARILNDFIIGGAGFTQYPANPSSIILSLNNKDTNFTRQLEDYLKLHDQLHTIYATAPLKEIETAHTFITRKIKEMVISHV